MRALSRNTRRVTAKMGEETPALRPVTMAIAQTVALCALGIPPSPHIRSS